MKYFLAVLGTLVIAVGVALIIRPGLLARKSSYNIIAMSHAGIALTAIGAAVAVTAALIGRSSR